MCAIYRICEHLANPEVMTKPWEKRPRSLLVFSSKIQRLHHIVDNPLLVPEPPFPATTLEMSELLHTLRSQYWPIVLAWNQSSIWLWVVQFVWCCLQVASVLDFEWQKQLRYYWDYDMDNCVVRMSNSLYIYGYEYLGSSPRLVITPLTVSCSWRNTLVWPIYIAHLRYLIVLPGNNNSSPICNEWPPFR